MVSTVEDVIKPVEGRKDGRNLKIPVEVDLAQPLMRKITVKTNGILEWVKFKYENAQDFYFSYG